MPTTKRQANMSSSATSPAVSATAPVVSVENSSVIGFAALLRNAGIPAKGYDASTFPGSTWHRVTISSCIDYESSTGHRVYCRLGYAWLPAQWTTQKVHTSLLAHYSQSFIIEDDSLEAHRSVSESLATSAPLGDTRV